MLLHRLPRIADIAARAGVSTATVDRVINGRPGVRETTMRRVAEAIRALDTPDPNAPAAGVAFDIVLAEDGSLVTAGLGEALAAALGQEGHRTRVDFLPRLDPMALAARLHACADSGECAGVAVQAHDHVLVREAMDRLAEAGIPVVTVLTDVAGTQRLAYVGLDNRAAGRTAGFLMARFVRRAGPVGIVWGGELYRSHEERESGFRNLLRAERPDLPCLDVTAAGDDPGLARAAVAGLLDRAPDLAGLYCVGGGVTGVIEAVADAGRDLVLIAHNYNAQTKHALLTGTIDALIHQDVGRIAALAAEALLARRAPEGGVAIDIITRENNALR